MKHLIRLTKLPLFILLFSLIYSCKKDLKDGEPEKNDLKSKTVQAEQAYPGLHGEILTTKFNGQTIYVEKKGDRYVWMGDIAFDQQTFDSLCKAEKNTAARTFKTTINNHWYWGDVYYTIDADFTTAEITAINNAIAHWQNNTGLNFIESASASNRIFFNKGDNGSGFFSDYIGKKGGQQVISLQAGLTTGVVIHEIGHAIGFYHEQCRTDRGNFIIFNSDNIVPGLPSQHYQYATWQEIGDNGAQIGDFDFESVMLYGSFANSNGVDPVMTTLWGGVWWAQRDGLSAGDIETANFIYGAPFGRLRYEISDFSSGYDIYRQADVFIDFFADEALTIPASLNTPRNIIIKKEVQQYYAGSWHTIPSSEFEITLPANVSSVQIENDMVTEDIIYDGADIYHGRREDNIYKSAFLRR
jgi:hypothetical protein